MPIFKLSPNRYESDLSNEVLGRLVALRIAKLLEVRSGKNRFTNQAQLENMGNGVK